MVVDCLKALSLSALSKHLFNGAFNYDAAWTKAILSRCKACDDMEIVCQIVSLKLLAASLSQQSNHQASTSLVENLCIFLQMYPPDDQSDHEHFLIDAVARNRCDIVSLLLSSGWDVNYITRGEQLTALKVAARDSRSDIVHLLLKHGANTLPKCDQEQVYHSALAYLVSLQFERDDELVRTLTDRTLEQCGDDVTLKQTVLNTVLCLTIEYRNFHNVGYFLSRGASPNAEAVLRDGRYRSCIHNSARKCQPLILAVAVGSLKTCQELIDAGADVNVFHDAQLHETPLMIAAGRQFYDIVRLLIKCSADVNFTSSGNDGETILSAALSFVYEDRLPTTTLLLLRCNAGAAGLGQRRYVHYGIYRLLCNTGFADGLRALVASGLNRDDVRLLHAMCVGKLFEEAFIRELICCLNQPGSLRDISRQAVWKQIRDCRRNFLVAVTQLELPDSLVRFLLLSDVQIGSTCADSEIDHMLG